jgi:hypothetical protein
MSVFASQKRISCRGFSALARRERNFWLDSLRLRVVGKMSRFATRFARDERQFLTGKIEARRPPDNTSDN